MYFYDKYALLCAKVGKAPSAVANDLGLDKSAVSHWKSRNSKPSRSVAVRIADYFGITVDELLEDKPKPEEKEKSPTSEDVRLLKMITDLTVEDKELIISMISKITKSRSSE